MNEFIKYFYVRTFKTEKQIIENILNHAYKNNTQLHRNTMILLQDQKQLNLAYKQLIKAFRNGNY